LICRVKEFSTNSTTKGETGVSRFHARDVKGDPWKTFCPVGLVVVALVDNAAIYFQDLKLCA